MIVAYRNGALCVEGVSLDDIANRFGTPCYVYSRAAIEDAYTEYVRALESPGCPPALICYSAKANSNLAVLGLIARLGAGFDIVSGGELVRVIAAGGDPRKVVFSGVGKTEDEISRALEADILCLNLESESELERVATIASRMGKRAPIAFRVNPDVDARTHPYISTGLRQSKFGVPYADAERLYRVAARMPGIHIVGIGCHIGSQLLDPAPYIEAAQRLARLADRIQSAGIALSHFDIGGGIGIRYKDEQPHSIGEFITGALAALGDRNMTLIVDPGRSIVGNAGVLLTRVEYTKHSESKNFLIVDAAMNDLLRPALYEAWHDVRPVHEPAHGSERIYDIVGPVCESGDFLAHDRRLAARAGDLLAILSAGAYGMAMSSNYNSRPRAAEVMVHGNNAHLVRRRERLEELFALERLMP
jgi:diaminopimelate decarboxylase